MFLEQRMLDKTQFAGTGNRFCASFDLEFVVDVPVVPVVSKIS